MRTTKRATKKSIREKIKDKTTKIDTSKAKPEVKTEVKKEIDLLNCDWRMFSPNLKDCIECDDYSKCKNQSILAARQMEYIGLTTGVIEPDAKEYAEYIREMDKIEIAMWREEATLESMDERPDDDPIIETSQYQSKGYRILAPVMKYLDNENVPTIYVPPDDLYVANFMMLSHRHYGVSLRLTAMKGVPSGAKFITKTYKSKGRTYKYTKTDDIETVFSLVKIIVRYRKRYEK